MMNQADPLAQLRDIHLPEPVSWWPPAPGWWFVAIASLAAVCWAVLLLIRYLRRNRYRRAALRELENCSIHAERNDLIVLEKVSVLLRRVAIQTFGRATIAPLSGESWLTFLDNTGNTDQFTQGPGKVLGSALYRPSVEADVGEVLQIVQKWIKEHRQ